MARSCWGDVFGVRVCFFFLGGGLFVVALMFFKLYFWAFEKTTYGLGGFLFCWFFLFDVSFLMCQKNTPPLSEVFWLSLSKSHRPQDRTYSFHLARQMNG